MRGVTREFGSAVEMRFVDVENPDNASLVRQYGATSIPVTVILNKNGQVSSIWRGVTTARRLKRAIEKVVISADVAIQN